MKNHYWRMSALLLGIICLACAFSACDDDPPTVPTKNDTVVGTIQDANGNAVVNALVEAYKDADTQYSTDLTDEKGAFTLTDLPEDQSGVMVRVSHTAFETFTGSLIDVVEGRVTGNTPGVIRMTARNDSTCCGTIIVCVQDSSDNSAIQGAEVKLRSNGNVIQVKESNSDGKAIFENVCEGSFDLRIAKMGYSVVELETEIDSCASDTLSAYLIEQDSCCDGVATIVVRDADDNEAIGNATVKLWFGGSIVETGQTNQNGVVVFDGLCSGDYGVGIFREGYASGEFEFEIGCDQNREFTTTLQNDNHQDSCCDGWVKFTVCDSSDNSALAGVVIKLWRERTVVKELVTDSTGMALCDDLCNGRYGVDLIREGYKSREFLIELGCNDTLITTQKMINDNEPEDSCCDGILKVIVLDQNTEEAVRGALVKLWKNGSLFETAETNADGFAIFDGLCDDEYGVGIIREEYQATEFEVEIPCNEDVVVTKTLQPKINRDSCCDGILYVQLRDDQTNQAIKNALVKLWQGNRVVKELRTNSDGVAFCDDLCDGEYWIDLIREGYRAQEFPINVECHDTVSITRTMQSDNSDSCCRGIAAIVVRDQENNSVLANALVKLWRGGRIVEDLRTNGDGVAIFDGLCEGGYGVEVIREGYQRIEFEFELDCNQQKEITRTLVSKQQNDTCCTAVFKSRVIDSENSQFVPGVNVVINLGNDQIAAGITNSEGWYIKEQLCSPAVYTITFSKVGYTSQTFTINYNECKIIQETFRLEPE